MLSDITKYGEKPAHALGELMRKNQVVGIGDGHGPNEPLQIKARDYLQALRQGGATHLVSEAPQGCSEMLKESNRSGKLDISQLPILAQVPNYVEMLKTARALGLTVVAGDARQQPLLNEDEDRLSRIRNTYMADTIKEILDEPGQDPQHPNKVVFWVGALHLEDLHRENKGNLPTAAEILRSYHVKLATVTYQQGDKLDLVERAAATVSEPTTISTSKAKSIGDYVRKSGSVQNSWDHVIFYPAQR